MAEDDPQQEPKPTQQTKPKKGEPIEIPIPTRDDWDKVLKRATKQLPQDQPAKDQGDPLTNE